MKRIWDKITGRAALKKEIQQERSKSDILSSMLSADKERIKYLEKQLAEEKSRADALLSVADKARKERNEVIKKLNNATDKLAVSERHRIGLQEMKGVSDEEADQLWGASNDPEKIKNFETQSRVLWREGKRAFREHQMAVSEVFDAIEKHVNTKKSLTIDDIKHYRDHASDAIGRRI